MVGFVLSVALWGPEWLLCAAVGKVYLLYLAARGAAIKEIFYFLFWVLLVIILLLVIISH